MLTTRYCSDCRDECAFERPPCADDHVSDCPEEICVECGFAVVVGDVFPDAALLQTTAA